MLWSFVNSTTDKEFKLSDIVAVNIFTITSKFWRTRLLYDSNYVKILISMKSQKCYVPGIEKLTSYFSLEHSAVHNR